MAMDGRAAQQQFPQQDAVYKVEFEEPEENGVRESLLCTEQLLPNENLMNEVGPQSSLCSMDHIVILYDPPGKILKKEGSPEVSKEEEEVDGEYYLDRKPESQLTQLTSLDAHPLAFYQPPNPTACYGDMNAYPPFSESEHNQELVLPSKSGEKVDLGSLDVTEKDTAKKKAKGTLERGGAPCVRLDNEQNAGLNQNLNLGHLTRRSARCVTGNNVGHQPSVRLCSVLLSKGNADGIQEQRDSSSLEISEEFAPPPRKKTRTFYNAKQLQELEKTFQEDHYPDNEKRREIAAAVGVTPQRVMVWFQNRRAKWRKIEKLMVKNTKKCSLIAPALPVDPQRMPQGTTMLAVTQLSDTVNNQPNTVTMGTAIMNYSGSSISLSASSVAPVPGRTSCGGSIQTKAPTSQGSLGFLRKELFPAISSPPPIRRTNLPFNLLLNPNPHIIPLMLDDSLASECSSSSQESSTSDGHTYSVQDQSIISSPMDCSYLEQLEPTSNLEAPCFHPNSHPGMHQHGQYPQHEMSHFPIHLSGNALPSVRLTTATPSKSTTFFSLPGSNGLVTYGAAECSQGFLQNHVGTHLLLQPSAGSSGYIPAFQAFPWNEFPTQGPSFTHSFSSPMPFSGLATITGGSAQQAPFAPNQTLPASSCFLQLPKGPGPGATLLFTTKPLMPINLELPSQPLPEMLAEQDLDPDSGPQEMESESLPDFSEDSKIGLNFSPCWAGDEKTA